jgi:hypothetical protein
MNNYEKFEHYIKSKGFDIITDKLTVIKGYNHTSENLSARRATLPGEFFNINIVYKWNNDQDFLELIHFSITPRNTNSYFSSVLYAGAFPNTNYRTASLTYFVADSELLQAHKDIYGKFINKYFSFGVLTLDNFSYKEKNSWYINNTNQKVKKEYDTLVLLSNEVSPHLCVDYPWFTYTKKKTFSERFFPNLKKILWNY